MTPRRYRPRQFPLRTLINLIGILVILALIVAFFHQSRFSIGIRDKNGEVHEFRLGDRP